MKVLRGFANFIIGLALIVLLFGLSLTFVIKTVVQDNIIISLAKDEILPKYLESDELKLTDEQKNIIKELLEDKQANDILNAIMDNYVRYVSEEDYKVTQKDIDLITDFTIRHEEQFEKLTKEEFNKEDVYENFTVEKVTEGAKNLFKMIDENFDTSSIETKTTIIQTYNDTISTNTKMEIIGGIIVCIILLMIINWSLYKWMKTTGVSIIISGVLVSMVYFAIDIVKKYLTQEELGISLESLNFNIIIIMGITEIVLGIIFIIGYSIIKKQSIKENV